MKHIDWINALKSTSIRELLNNHKIQLALFTEIDLFEFVALDEYPG